MEQADHPQCSTHFTRWPKVELHRHLEGCLRLRSLAEIAAAYELDFGGEPAGSPGALETLAALVQVGAGETASAGNFLAKFRTLRRFFLSEEIIRRFAAEAVEDAAAENIRHLELRFTPAALSHARGFALEAVMGWVCEAAQTAARGCGISVVLIASVNRHESPALAERTAAAAAEMRSEGVVGLDLAGDEANAPAAPFRDIFSQARRRGLRVTVHAGEWSGATSVIEALRDFEADRIGHGVRVVEDPRATALARKMGTPFEVCITSNLQSGVFPSAANFPLAKMLAAGLNVTLNSDDPGVSRITLSGEYRRACSELLLTETQLRGCILAAARACFLPDEARRALGEKIEKEFNLMGINGE